MLSSCTSTVFHIILIFNTITLLSFGYKHQVFSINSKLFDLDKVVREMVEAYEAPVPSAKAGAAGGGRSRGKVGTEIARQGGLRERNPSDAFLSVDFFVLLFWYVL